MNDIKKIANYLAERYNFMCEEKKKEKDTDIKMMIEGEKFTCIKTMKFINDEFGITPDIELNH